jgi:hypothetical protein
MDDFDCKIGWFAALDTLFSLSLDTALNLVTSGSSSELIDNEIVLSILNNLAKYKHVVFRYTNKLDDLMYEHHGYDESTWLAIRGFTCGIATVANPRRFKYIFNIPEVLIETVKPLLGMTYKSEEQSVYSFINNIIKQYTRYLMYMDKCSNAKPWECEKNFETKFVGRFLPVLGFSAMAPVLIHYVKTTYELPDTVLIKYLSSVDSRIVCEPRRILDYKFILSAYTNKDFTDVEGLPLLRIAYHITTNYRTPSRSSGAIAIARIACKAIIDDIREMIRKQRSPREEGETKMRE